MELVRAGAPAPLEVTGGSGGVEFFNSISTPFDARRDD